MNGTCAMIGCALGLLTLACAKQGSDGAPVADSSPVRVETTLVVAQSVPRLLPLTGTLVAELRSELTANATGRVVRTFVERGQKVEQGTVIAQLDVRAATASAAEAAASVESARTQLEAARAECGRYDGLVARGAITAQEHDRQTAICKQHLAAVAVSQARASSMALAVGDGTIRAPFAGVVSERTVRIGEFVTPSSKVATVLVGNPLRLELTIPELRIADIKAGELVTFSPIALGDRVFSGHVKFVSGEVRAATRDVVVEAVVPNSDGVLLPGMFVKAHLHTGERHLPVVPRSAVFDAGVDHCVYVVVDRRLALRIVKVNVELQDVLAIEDGVSPGDAVVVKPAPSLFDGALVEN